MLKHVVVIGSGFAGLSAATYLAKQGHNVTVIEKHDKPGGRARNFSAEGFIFDMGPSWYWMPDVFERYFENFGKSVSDYYQLDRLDPSYRVYWQESQHDVPADMRELETLFESIEIGSSGRLREFLLEAEFKYNIGVGKLVYKPGLSITEFADLDVVKGVSRLDVFTSMKKHVRKYFKHPKLIQLMEFPVLFLGALPANIPALYSLMNYADIKLGTWYPQGGMYSIVRAMHDLAVESGVSFQFETDASKIEVVGGVATGLHVVRNGSTSFVSADIIVGAADYHFVETQLLPEEYRSYSEKYWDKKTMAPSCLIYYVGLDKKLKNTTHHSLFFDVNFDTHGEEIYESPAWPTDPLFYVCTPSVSDDSVAPSGCENLFFLIPVATGLEGDDEVLRKKYFEKIITRFEKKIGESVTDSIIFFKSYATADFVNDYNAYKGNAYGLANTLMQTALLKPSIKSKKVKNLYYTGQLTVPGPGVPPSLISGEVVAGVIKKVLTNT